MRLVSTRSILLSGFCSLLTGFQRLYTVFEEPGDELIALDAIEFRLGQLFFVAVLQFAVHGIRFYSFGALAVLNIYNVATRLPFAFVENTVDLFAVVAKVVHSYF